MLLCQQLLMQLGQLGTFHLFLLHSGLQNERTPQYWIGITLHRCNQSGVAKTNVIAGWPPAGAETRRYHFLSLRDHAKSGSSHKCTEDFPFVISTIENPTNSTVPTHTRANSTKRREFEKLNSNFPPNGQLPELLVAIFGISVVELWGCRKNGVNWSYFQSEFWRESSNLNFQLFNIILG